MNSAERDRLVIGYLRHVMNLGVLPVPATAEDLVEAQALARLVVEGDDSFWAWEEFANLAATDCETAWQVLLQIITLAPEQLLHIVGAGPLESLVSHGYEILAERVIEELKTNGRFMKAFRSAYLFDIPEATWRAFNDAMIVAGIPESELGT